MNCRTAIDNLGTFTSKGNRNHEADLRSRTTLGGVSNRRGRRPARSPKPILQNVKLEASKDGVLLLATDLEVGVRIQHAGDRSRIAGHGPAVDRPLRPDPAREQRYAGCIWRRRRRARWSAASGASSACRRRIPNEFPAWPQFTEAKYHELPARLLRELIRRTLFATDNESSRYALGGVLLELTDDKITAVGTDGRRLAKMEGPAKSVGGHQTADMHDDRPDAGHATDRAGA